MEASGRLPGPGSRALCDARLVHGGKVRLPARVVAGDKVRLVSPASYPEPEWIGESVRVLEGWGLVAEVAGHALARWGYMAGRDSERLADLNEALRDPAVRAVITTRGGAGAYPLPASARRHRPWWANERSGSHVHASAWMGVGRRTTNVDLSAGVVDFTR